MGDFIKNRVHPEEMGTQTNPREGAGGSSPSFGSDTPHLYNSGSMTVPAAGQGNVANQQTTSRFDLYPQIPAAGANSNHVDVTSVSHITQTELAPPIWIFEVPRQVVALTKKNMILARRNLTSTLVRTCSSAFFMLLIYLVNEGLKARYSNEAYFQNLKDASSLRKQVPGIPGCVPKSGYQTCVTFAYTPAPWNEYQPDKDYEQVQDFAQAVKDKGRTECDNLCSAGACDAAGIQQVAGSQPAPKCARCCEMHRVHKIVRTIMTHNGTAKAGDTRTCSEGGPCPIEPSKVLGFETEAAMDTYLMKYPEFVQGAYIFASPHANATTFMVQQNSTASNTRGVWKKPYIIFTLPMQVTASKAIATQIIRRVDATASFEDMNLYLQPFAHPPQNIASYEGQIAPLFLIACAMFPFSVQIAEVVSERELKLRQALAAMGLHDTSYWLSWHIYQSVLAFLNAFLLYCFGCLFQLKIFIKNDFGVVLLTFWLHGQAMVGLAFLASTVLSRSTQAVAMGFATFLLGFVVYFMVGLFGFPYGQLDGTLPFAFDTNITTGIPIEKTTSDRAAAPILSMIPPAMLVQDLNVMGRFTLSEKDAGMRMANISNYCTPERSCDSQFSLGSSWGIFIALYLIYSVIALYLDNVLTDAMGVRKPLWYFVTPAYWGLGKSYVKDCREVVEPSTDPDVLEEEARIQARMNEPADIDSAIEVRGLIAEFRRNGKPFFAVKAPWYKVKKNHLLALLGPNGAGKTTTVNMLTGFIPPSRGNALIMGRTVAHPAGMSAVRRVMGVCPQFDTLWAALSAREHLQLFAAIKGVQKNDIPLEATRRIEEVRLTDAADRMAGTYSGGMRRRLSVAIALIGNPQVVFLDEPTTGMDPINRRHVWDVIEAAKQDRCVILTTHSMEEADVLGDTVAIMAKGRLRCLGSTVRLKARFGAGYKLSVSLGDRTDQDSPQLRAVHEIMNRHLAARPAADSSKSHVHYNIPSEKESMLTLTFAELEARRVELGIVDLQIEMSTLEDVFLKIAKDSEVEEAIRDNRKTAVTLNSGEVEQVLVGSEEPYVSPNGVHYRVVWNTDENGQLVASDTLEDEPCVVTAVAPADATARIVSVEVDGRYYSVPVPDGVGPCSEFKATVQVRKQEASSEAAIGNVAMSRTQVAERMSKLKTPVLKQANALFRKNLSYQKKRRLTNCCLCFVPMIVIGLILLVQFIVEVLFLSQPRFRCPYCGPADDAYGRSYCNKAQTCQAYFFPTKDREELSKKFGIDVVDECTRISGTCGGAGNLTCFKPEWSSGFQQTFCPFTLAPSQPSFGYMPPPVLASKTPVLYTSDTTAGDAGVVDKVVKKMFGLNLQDAGFRKLKGSMDFATSMLFQLLVAVPLAGCANLDITSQMDETQEAAVCKLLQYGQGYEAQPCCVDLTDMGEIDKRNTGLGTGYFAGELVSGLNYWSPTPSLHNDGVYNTTLRACLQTQQNREKCNAGIIRLWTAAGALFGSGIGKFSIQIMVGKVLGGPSAFSSSTQKGGTSGLASLYVNASGFRCVSPVFPTAVETQMQAGSFAQGAEGASGEKCVNLHAGLAIIAKYAKFPPNFHPPPEPQDIPDCTQKGTCQQKQSTVLGEEKFLLGGGRWAQVCDLYMENTAKILKNVGSETTTATLVAINQIPCTCRWLSFAKQLTSTMLFPSGLSSQVSFLSGMPKIFNCPLEAATGKYKCNAFSLTHPLSIPELWFTTPAFATSSFYIERALQSNDERWWNREHVSDKYGYVENERKLMDPQDKSCEPNCWETFKSRGGNVSLVTSDCKALAGAACFLQRLGNISNLEVGCTSAASERLESNAVLDARTYAGFYDRFTKGGEAQEEFLNAFDFSNTKLGFLNATVIYNDTSSSPGGPPPSILRIANPVRVVFDSYLNVRLDSSDMRTYTAAMTGVKEMPKNAFFLSLDIGATMGPFFFTLAFHILFPTIVVGLVYEKEVNLRVVMKMMGLGTGAYWIINYAFWIFVYSLFSVIFLVVASVVQLPSGYKVGIITRQSYSMHFVLFFLFINHTVSFAMLCATLFRSSRVSQIFATLWILVMSLIAFTAWDTTGGNFFNSETVSRDLKNLITIIPVWSFYRAWTEYVEYSQQAAFRGTSGLQWSDLQTDPQCGMGTVLIVLAVQWPCFLLMTGYLDQVLDTGNGLPRHPLFFLGYDYAIHASAADELAATHDSEGLGGVMATMKAADVQAEEERVRRMVAAGEEGMDAVIVRDIAKTFAGKGAGIGVACAKTLPGKIAVRTLSMGVPHGECFGMLGPNGAGKTTTINMLVGMFPPTSGTATVEGLDVRTDMNRIYTLMGVCPQHDILWDTLTPRQHLSFYGRLKNLTGKELMEAIAHSLREVNLLHVIDEEVRTFSGGMKRRMSVAISLIGSPLVQFLDEPSTGLDPASRRTLWSAIKRAKLSRAVFLTTHSMEEAENLCDRLGIFVDGSLRCIGTPKDLTARFGAFYVLTASCESQHQCEAVSRLVMSLSPSARITYSLAGTIKFEMPISEVSLAKVFEVMTAQRAHLGIRDWGISNTTLEEAFIKISRGVQSSD